MIFSFEKLYLAYLDCRKRKRKTINALKFEWDLEKNLFLLLKELRSKKYKPGRSICFVVEKPVPREIFAADFRDRIVHHLLVREIESRSEKDFIFDSFSCRKGKGTHKAVTRLKRGIKKLSQNYSKEIYYAQLDISGFFMSINCPILYQVFRRMVLKEKRSVSWKKEVLWLAKTIIFYQPTKNYSIKGNPSLFSLIPSRKSLFNSSKETGLPIGNYSSQFFANLYLNELDQFVKRKLNCRHYFRYVDDLVLLSETMSELVYFKKNISYFLKNYLNLNLNNKKTKFKLVEEGINFLGYYVKPGYVLVRKRVVSNFIYRLKKINRGEYCSSNRLAIISSYLGHFRHADSFNLRKKIFEKFNNLEGLLVSDKVFSLKRNNN
jgi:RNA-directed DNA polymerase